MTTLASVDPNIGRVLDGKYEITRTLGAGGIGAVYEVRHQLIDRRLAIKLLHSEYAREQDVVQRFRREATTTAAIGHPHILEITDMGSTPEGEVFMVMELLHGCDLAQLLEQEGPLEVELACHIAIQILSALEATHAKGIVHRDLKPANVFLIERGGNRHFVKLVDFGISKVRASEDSMARGLTRTGELLGTPSYMAPEQARGEPGISGAADIYAVGVILYEMLTGRTPYEAPSYVALLMKILQDEVPDPRAARPDLDPALAAIIMRAMAKPPPERFVSAAEFRRALAPYSPETLVQGTHENPGLSLYAQQNGPLVRASAPTLDSDPVEGRGTTPLMLTEPVPARRRGRTRALLLGLGAALVVAAGGTVAWQLGGGTAPPEEAARRPATAGERPPPPAPFVPASPVPAAREDAPAEPSPAPASPARMVELELKVAPPYAEVKIDGRAIGRGTRDVQLAADGQAHVVEVSAPGFETQSHEFVLDDDVQLSCDLERLRSAGRPGRTRGAGVEPAAETAPPAAAAPPPKPAPPAKPRPAKRQIDEDEPW